MSDLHALQIKWVVLFDELSCDDRFGGKIAPPFFSVWAGALPSILYVGKATSKDGCDDGSVNAGNPKERVEKGRLNNAAFLRKCAPNYNSGFWQLARELNAQIAARGKIPNNNCVQHIIWTNISKIGTIKGNPSGSLLKKQRILSVETLREEIETYKPRLIWFVTWDYEEDAVNEVLRDSNGHLWNKTGNEDWIWSRPATNTLPAAILSGHPQGKSIELVRKWLQTAMDFLPVQSDQ